MIGKGYGTGMLPLLRKELRGLRAFAVFLVVLYFALSVLDDLLRIIDQSSFQHMIDSLADDKGSSYLAFIVAFAIGLSMPASEHDSGTIAFLDMLPTTRTRVYIAKVVAGALVLGLVPLADLAEMIPQSMITRNSLDTDVHLPLLAQLAALHYGVSLFGFATGLALAMVRRMAWALLAVAYCIEAQLEHLAPSIALWTPNAVMHVQMHGARIVWPLAAIARQSILACVLAVAGGVAFAYAGDASRFFAVIKRGRVAAFFGTTFVVVAWIVAAVILVKDDDRKKPPPSTGPLAGVHFVNGEPIHIITRAYDFAVRTDITEKGRAQIIAADALATKTRARFPAFPAKALAEVGDVGRISVDATAPLGVEMNAGQTEWKAVAVDSNVIGRDDFDEVVSHETAHVLLNVLSNRRMHEKGNATHLFNEGLASVVAEDVAGTPPRYRLAAAFARARGLVQNPADLLFDDHALHAKLDPLHDYALGRELVRATIDVGGDMAPMKVVAALDEAPKDLDGITLWRDAYQRAGLNLDKVLARFSQRLDDIVTEKRAVIKALPRALAAVAVEGNEVVVRVSLDGTAPEGARPMCQLRTKLGAPQDQTAALFATDGECRVPKSKFPSKADVQVGLNVDEVPLFETWTTVTY